MSTKTRQSVKQMIEGVLSTPPAEGHSITYHHEDRPLVGCCLRARCSCGWWSDSYAMHSDAYRAAEVHLKRVRREEFEALIKRSSIGAAVEDVRARGIDAHLRDLERGPHRRRRKTMPKKKPAAKREPTARDRNVERLRAALREACELADEANGDPSSCSYVVPIGERIAELRKLADELP